MGKLVVWFQGKKTIIGGSILIVAGIAGAFFGKVSLVDATTLVGAGISVCGIGAKANRFLGALSNVAQAGVDLRLGNKAGAIAELQPVLGEALSAAAPALSINVSGSASAVAQAVTDMAMKPAPPRVVSSAELQALFAKSTGNDMKSLVAVEPAPEVKS